MKHSEVFRAGVTAKKLKSETSSIQCTDSSGGPCVEFWFQLASKGGGSTRVCVQIDSEDFLELFSAMVRANRTSAMDAAAANLSARDFKLFVDSMTSANRQRFAETAAEALLEHVRGEPGRTRAAIKEAADQIPD